MRACVAKQLRSKCNGMNSCCIMSTCWSRCTAATGRRPWNKLYRACKQQDLGGQELQRQCKTWLRLRLSPTGISNSLTWVSSPLRLGSLGKASKKLGGFSFPFLQLLWVSGVQSYVRQSLPKKRGVLTEVLKKTVNRWERSGSRGHREDGVLVGTTIPVSIRGTLPCNSHATASLYCICTMCEGRTKTFTCPFPQPLPCLDSAVSKFLFYRWGNWGLPRASSCSKTETVLGLRIFLLHPLSLSIIFTLHQTMVPRETASLFFWQETLGETW